MHPPPKIKCVNKIKILRWRLLCWRLTMSETYVFDGRSQMCGSLPGFLLKWLGFLGVFQLGKTKISVKAGLLEYCPGIPPQVHSNRPDYCALSCPRKSKKNKKRLSKSQWRAPNLVPQPCPWFPQWPTTPDPNTSAKASWHKWEVHVMHTGGLHTASNQ